MDDVSSYSRLYSSSMWSGKETTQREYGKERESARERHIERERKQRERKNERDYGRVGHGSGGEKFHLFSIGSFGSRIPSDRILRLMQEMMSKGLGLLYLQLASTTFTLEQQELSINYEVGTWSLWGWEVGHHYWMERTWTTTITKRTSRTSITVIMRLSFLSFLLDICIALLTVSNSFSSYSFCCYKTRAQERGTGIEAVVWVSSSSLLVFMGWLHLLTCQFCISSQGINTFYSYPYLSVFQSSSMSLHHQSDFSLPSADN